jgi:biopolymer transport protein ExbD
MVVMVVELIVELVLVLLLIDTLMVEHRKLEGMDVVGIHIPHQSHSHPKHQNQPPIHVHLNHTTQLLKELPKLNLMNFLIV